MKSFRKFLLETEVTSTRRRGIIHLENMKDINFVKFLQKVSSELDGKLKNIPIKMKVDGLGARFGKDDRGRVFFEGSRTGPVFEPKSFSKYAIGHSKRPEVIQRSFFYDDILDVFQKSSFAKNLPNNTKVVCEVLYNPMAEMVDDGYIFVKTKYDKKKLGSLMTIVPFTVLLADTGEEHPEKDAIIDKLLKSSTNEIKIVDSNLKIEGEIDIQGYIDPIKTFDEETFRVLSSRKKADRGTKIELQNMLARIKVDLSLYLLNNEKIVDRFRLGREFEGIVIHIDGQQYKVTTPEFREKLRKEKEQRGQ